MLGIFFIAAPCTLSQTSTETNNHSRVHDPTGHTMPTRLKQSLTIKLYFIAIILTWIGVTSIGDGYNYRSLGKKWQPPHVTSASALPGENTVYILTGRTFSSSAWSGGDGGSRAGLMPILDFHRR